MIGFVAGLYLASVVERNLVAMLLLVVLLPIFGTSGFLVWNAVPHALRPLIGPDQRLLLPAAALGGGTLLVLADTVARTLSDNGVNVMRVDGSIRASTSRARTWPAPVVAVST